MEPDAVLLAAVGDRVDRDRCSGHGGARRGNHDEHLGLVGETLVECVDIHDPCGIGRHRHHRCDQPHDCGDLLGGVVPRITDQDPKSSPSEPAGEIGLKPVTGELERMELRKRPCTSGRRVVSGLGPTSAIFARSARSIIVKTGATSKVALVVVSAAPASHRQHRADRPPSSSD